MNSIYVKWKGRTLLLIDVPPMLRLPGGVDLGLDNERYVTWNEKLLSQAESFAESTGRVFTHLVSPYCIIGDLPDSPETYGLEARLRSSVTTVVIQTEKKERTRTPVWSLGVIRE